jgi:hypothetical protein
MALERVISIENMRIKGGVPIGHRVEDRFGVSNDSQPQIHEPVTHEPDHFGRNCGTRPGN